MDIETPKDTGDMSAFPPAPPTLWAALVQTAQVWRIFRYAGSGYAGFFTWIMWKTLWRAWRGQRQTAQARREQVALRQALTLLHHAAQPAKEEPW
jgi:hypothetical protein